MKIQIIGLGIVGTAQAYLFQQLNIRDVVGYDIKINNHSYCDTNDCIIGDVDITFICTPEDVVEDVIRSLVEIDHKGIIVIRSTVPIGMIKYLSEKFDIHICHNPEFLKEEAYLDDIMNPNMIVIGECCQKHGDMLEELYKPINKPITRVDTTASELIKLAANAHLSTLITFWNEINELCQKLKLDTKTVSDIIGYDPRISSYGCNFFGIPYSGKCLPKDTRHLIEGFRSHGLNPKLFEACDSFNERLAKTIEDEKRIKTKNDIDK